TQTKCNLAVTGTMSSDEALMLEFQRGSLSKIPNPGSGRVRDRFRRDGLKGNNLEVGRDPSPRLEVGDSGFNTVTVRTAQTKCKVAVTGTMSSDEALMLEFQRGSLSKIPNPGSGRVRDRFRWIEGKQSGSR